MKQDFSISILDTAGQSDQILGNIQVGDFTESFSIATDDYRPNDYMNQWLEALRSFVNGTVDRIALMTWMHPRGVTANRRAWVLYREGERVFVQDRLVPATASDRELVEVFRIMIDERGVFVGLPDILLFNEEGQPISTWETLLEEIKKFLDENAG